MTDEVEAAGIGGEESDALSETERAYFENAGEAEASQPIEPDGSGQEDQQQEDGPAQAQPRDERGKFVPHGALHAEREEHKKTRAELQELQHFRTRMEERWRLAEQMMAPRQEERAEDRPPDPEEDIFAYAKWQAQQLEGLKQQADERAKAEQQAAQSREIERRVWNHWQESARSYAQENADFGNAAQWLSEHRDKQLQALAGVDARFQNVGARNAQIEQELRGIVISAAQQNKSPAELVYQIAQSYGYKPAAAQGQMPEQLERVQKAQQASRSISQASGRSGADEVTPDMIAGMSDTEFSAWYAKPGNAARFDRLMQG